MLTRCSFSTLFILRNGEEPVFSDVSSFCHEGSLVKPEGVIPGSPLSFLAHMRVLILFLSLSGHMGATKLAVNTKMLTNTVADF